MIIEVQLKKYVSQKTGSVSYVNVSCTLVMLKNIYLIRNEDLYIHI